jgi:hypothetical protein
MPEPREGPDSLEGLAFQLILHKLVSVERAMQGIPPLLKKIVDQLEAQTKQPEVPIATYAQLYPELPQETAEGADEETHAPEAGQESASSEHVQARRWWHWFIKEG